MAPGGQKGLFQAVGQQSSIGQPGQRVVIGFAVQGFFGLLAPGEIADNADTAEAMRVSSMLSIMLVPTTVDRELPGISVSVSLQSITTRSGLW